MSTIWIINQYASTPKTGMGGRHWHFARELARRGHRVYLIAARWHHLLRDDADEVIPDTEWCEGFQFVRVATPRYAHAHDKRRFFNWILFSWRLRHLAKQIPDAPDAILCSSPSLFSVLGAERLAKRFGARLVFEVRDIWPLTLVEVGGYSRWHPFIRLMQWIEDRAYRKADRVISNLPGAVDHMVSRGMVREKFKWIPNGFSKAEVDHPEPASETAVACIPQGKFLVGYAGTFGVANALETLLDAAELLRDRRDIAFVLLGHGKEKLVLEHRAAASSLTNVHFIPPVSKGQVQYIINYFDVCSVGLRSDPLFRFGVSPNKLFDYLAAAKPVIYAIDSGIYRPVEEFQAGVQVPPQDPQALAEAILQIQALSEEDRHRVGENGRRAALLHHEYSMLAQQLEDTLLSPSTAHLAATRKPVTFKAQS